MRIRSFFPMVGFCCLASLTTAQSVVVLDDFTNGVTWQDTDNSTGNPVAGTWYNSVSGSNSIAKPGTLDSSPAQSGSFMASSMAGLLSNVPRIFFQ